MRKFFFGIGILSLFSCTQKLAGTNYGYSNDSKAVSIKFINDSLCEIQQIFFCKKIDSQYQKKTILAKYSPVRFGVKYYNSNGPVIEGIEKRRNYKGVVVRNLNCQGCSNYFVIPKFIENSCLEKSDSIIEKMAGFGKINNFLNDTLILEKDILYFGPFKASLINSNK